MKKILLRADDLGYSQGVNFGIQKSVQEGLIRDVGMMTNMPFIEHGLKLLPMDSICLGQHTNICVGKPLANPTLIPSLINEQGDFKSSKEYRTASEDFVVLEEVIIEIEAQYRRFVELTGRQPDYLEAHAVTSNNFYKGLEIVAKKYHLKYSGLSLGKDPINIGNTKVYMHMDSMQPNYDPEISLKDMVEHAHEDSVDMMIFHPGYIDGYLLKNSSLTLPRAMEVDVLCNPVIKEWLHHEDVTLVNHNDL